MEHLRRFSTTLRAAGVLLPAIALAACTPTTGPETEGEPADAAPTADVADEPTTPEEPGEPATPEPSGNDADDHGRTANAGTPPPDAGGEAPGVTIPSCEDLVDPASFSNYFFDRAGEAEVIPANSAGSAASYMADEDMQPLMERAAEPTVCTYGIPATEELFSVIIAPLPEPLANEVEAYLEAGNYPDFHPPARGYAYEDPDSGSAGVHLLEDDVWFVFQGGPGSITADDAERHGFATILGQVADRTLG